MGKKLSTWRQIALTTWTKPHDPTAYGVLDLDVEEALQYLAALRESSGEKVTLTHLVGKAVAMAMFDVPEVNAFVSFGNLVQRKTIDVFFQVSFFDKDDTAENKGEPGAKVSTDEKKPNLAGAKVRETDLKDLATICKELREKAEKIRGHQHDEVETMKGAKTLAMMPTAMVGWATKTGGFLSYDLGLNLSRFGIPFDAFGSCMVTNVGTFGIPLAMAPLVAFSRVPMVLTLGVIRDAPSVWEGKLCIRKRASIGIAFDHRVMDGYHAGIMAKKFTAIVENPKAYFAA